MIISRAKARDQKLLHDAVQMLEFVTNKYIETSNKEYYEHIRYWDNEVDRLRELVDKTDYTFDEQRETLFDEINRKNNIKL